MTTRTGHETAPRALATVLAALAMLGAAFAQEHSYQDSGELQAAAPPGGPALGSTAQPAADGQLRVDSRDEVSYAQQASDRYECDISAVDQSGYDPTLANGGVPSDAEPAKRTEYLRAEAACLESRGYRVNVKENRSD